VIAHKFLARDDPSNGHRDLRPASALRVSLDVEGREDPVDAEEREEG
jgi:hypothetical protein